MIPLPLFANKFLQSLGLGGYNWRRGWRKVRPREEQHLMPKACSGGLSSTGRIHLTNVVDLGIKGVG